ncbi:hypothetical protein [Desulfosediminicola flagellatus]|uniref:hypothetical protein n=1 Tax=Desulfosediminicola flagellatus TaxID=2569541 RepID=UPI0010AC01B9|nr:hypothetical protein [Desulfosediminicola flagellatus]
MKLCYFLNVGLLLSSHALKRIGKSTLTTIVLLTILCLPAYADGSDVANDSWRFTLIGYLHLAGINGDVTVKGETIEVNESFSDLIENADFGGSFHLEARKGKWGVFVDPMYMKMSADEEAGPLNVGIEVEQWLVEVGGIYEISNWSLGNTGDRLAKIDLLAGGRYFSLEIDMDFNLLPEVNGKGDWVDPFVGIRFQADLTNKVKLLLRGDIGGFGIGSAPDFAWNVHTALGYDLSEKSTLWFGYRVLDVDYEDESDVGLFGWDMTTSGFEIGYAYRF